MTTFTIDKNNEITLWASSPQIAESGEGTEAFSGAQELEALAAQWPGGAAGRDLE